MAGFTDVRLLDSSENPFALASLIDFGPPPGSAAEIAQNVRTLLRTAIWSVPLDRLIGIDFRFLDLPIPVAQIQIQAELFQKINYYEPRVAASELAFKGEGLSGYLEPTVKLEFQAAALPERSRRLLTLPT